MDLITLDFETYYSKEYSLIKMTTEAYIRHESFQVICVGVRRNGQPTQSYWGNVDELAEALDKYDIPNNALLCHNSAFDGLILSEHFNLRPKFWFDTLSMSRAINNVYPGNALGVLAAHYGVGTKGTEVVDAMGKRRDDFTPHERKEYMRYCRTDVDLTVGVFKKLKDYFRKDELMVIDTTIRMYTEPLVTIDAEVLEDHLYDIIKTREKLLNKLGGEKAAVLLRSNDKFAALLRRLGVKPPMKVSKTTGKPTYAFAKTDAGFQALLKHEDPRVQLVTEVRLGTKSSIEETRTLALLGVSKRGPLPIMLNYYGAHTGRFSGGDKLNLQNLPSRGNNKIRTSLCAPAGYKLAVCDSAQIEARIVAWLAGQQDLIEAFARGEDVYCQFASEVYGRDITKADKEERFVGKTSILGLGYGMGWELFKHTLMTQGGVEVSDEEAQRIVKLYRSKYPMITRLWRVVQHALEVMAMGGIGMVREFLPYTGEGFVLPNGMLIRYFALQQTSDGLAYINLRPVAVAYVKGDKGAIYKGTRIYGGKATENIVQALARIVITDQMLSIRNKHDYRVLFQVHDELIFAVPEDSAEECMKNILIEMAKPPVWAPDIPVACEGGLADNYGEAK